MAGMLKPVVYALDMASVDMDVSPQPGVQQRQTDFPPKQVAAVIPQTLPASAAANAPGADKRPE